MALRILTVLPFLLVSFSFICIVSPSAQEFPAKERCAPGHSYEASRGECVPCDQQCRTGLAGICGRGIWNCDGDAPVCEPAVRPGERMEICNGEDDDCNNEVDDGFDKDADGYTTCSGDCNDRDQAVHPDAVERCDGLDNNCNGLIDDGFNVGGHCTAGKGACQGSGQLSCREDGLGVVCDAVAGQPSKEVCDGVDNDCDGEVDEGLGELTCGTGECMRRVPACAGGREGSCSPGDPGIELCGDGVDNDCDGRADEGFEGLGRSCEDGTGACRAKGRMVCSDDALSIRCSAVPGEPSVEICGNRIDDDCDGVVDLDAPGLGEPCTNGMTGACEREGTMVCNAAAGEVVCSAPKVEPSKEVCDGVDNDCDGEVDEGVQNACAGCGELPGAIGSPCLAVAGEECSAGVWACSGEEIGKAVCRFEPSMTDNDKCASDGSQCTVDRCKNGLCAHEPAANGISCDDFNPCTVGEICMDGKCSGGKMLACDDGNPCTEDSCDPQTGCLHSPVGQGFESACGGCLPLGGLPGGGCRIEGRHGPCSTGINICQPDGTMICVQSIFAREEICNGADDDCDGEVDEDLGTKECGIGRCRRAIPACQGGREAKCVPGDPSTETCANMGVDDDCNGVLDDIASLGTACAVTVGTCVIPGKLACIGDAQSPLCVAADPSDALDADADGTPNYCEQEHMEARALLGPGPEAGAGTSLIFDPSRTRAAVLPFREVYDSVVLGSGSPDSAILLVSGSTGDKSGFAVLRAKDVAKEHFSFTSCETSVGEHPRRLVLAGGAGSVIASSGGGYLRYHKIASQIPSPEAGGPACRLYGERLAVPDMRMFASKKGEQGCDAESVESLALLSERPLAFAGAVRCRIRLGAAQARVSELLGLDLLSEGATGNIAHEFVPVIAGAGEIEHAGILPLGNGPASPIFVVAMADGKSQAGLCSRSAESGWACSISGAGMIDSKVEFMLRVDGGNGPAEILLIGQGGEAFLATVEGPSVAIRSAGRAGSATSGGRIEDAVEISGSYKGGRLLAVGRQRSVTAAILRSEADSRAKVSPLSGAGIEPRSVRDDVSPGGKFSFERPHAMSAIPIKVYGGRDLFVAFKMQTAGRPVGSMGFVYWNSNEPPGGGISDIVFDGTSGKAKLRFFDPTGDSLRYRAWIRAKHGGSLDHWIDRIEGASVVFSVRGDASAVGLWPISITAEAIDTAGAYARSTAVVGRDGTVESISETSENP